MYVTVYGACLCLSLCVVRTCLCGGVFVCLCFRVGCGCAAVLESLGRHSMLLLLSQRYYPNISLTDVCPDE